MDFTPAAVDEAVIVRHLFRSVRTVALFLYCPETQGEHDQAQKPHRTQNALQKTCPRVQRRTIVDGKEPDRDEEEEDGDPRENARLKDELEAARRAGARQAAPFSIGAPKRRPRRPGRKPGRA